ncbi:MAG: hypothetical protein E6H58_16020 [Betaproteobacteria bacterium]|nr:MAG: hypothetical protein E6H58_16020 [Betaproteobacteria bacterium]
MVPPHRPRTRRQPRRRRAANALLDPQESSPVATHLKEILMSKKLLLNCVYGQEDAERATLPFIVANVAATADQESLVFLTAEAVRIATRGYAEPIRAHGMKPLAEVMQSYLDNGGTIWACGACTGPRGITEADLIPGAKIVTAVNLVEQLAAGAVPLNLT